MGRYDSHINPLQYRLNEWLNRRTNDHREREPKSIPSHVQKMEKDFMHIAFETGNSIFTPPIVKMPQSFSRFGREPTQTKDMGLAVPGDYYMGGISAFAGGRTNFYPRGNLSTLSFQPVSNLEAPNRDYDQHWECGGPNGWRCKVQEKQTNLSPPGAAQGESGGNGSGGSTSPAVARTHRQIMQQRTPIGFAANGSSQSNGGGSQQQQQQQQDYTEFSFDKDGQIISQSKDRKHYLKITQKDKKVMLTGEGDSTLFGKNNAYLNSGSLCVVDPTAQGEESGAGWDSQSQGGGGASGGTSGGIGGMAVLSREIAVGIMATPMTALTRTRRNIMLKSGVINPLDGGGGGGDGGGGGGKVYLGANPKKGHFCKVMTECGVSKNVYATV